MTGRDRTCDASRFRRALYRAELRSRVGVTPRGVAGRSRRLRVRRQSGGFRSADSCFAQQAWARLGSNQQPLVCETSALHRYPGGRTRHLRLRMSPSAPPGSCGRVSGRLRRCPARRAGSSGRESARRIPPRDQAPGQGVEPRPPRSERGVLPVRRSRTASAPPSTPPVGDVDAVGEPCRSTASRLCSSRQCRRCFPCHSPYPSTLDHRSPGCATRERPPTWRGFGARVSHVAEMPRQKHALIASAHSDLRAEESFSLRRGLDSTYVFFKLGITSGCRSIRLRNDEGDHNGSPSTGWICG